MDLLPAIFGSALLASFITGGVSILTTKMLLADHLRARQEADTKAAEAAARARIEAEARSFLNHFVTGGLEVAAAHCDALAHMVDVSYRTAKRNRSLVIGMRGATDRTAAGWTGVKQVKDALDPLVAQLAPVDQARLVVFPGDYMQFGLVINRCLALADDWFRRYPWTQDDRMASVDRFLTDLPTTLAAAARSLQVAAAIARQREPMSYANWFPSMLNDERLVQVGAQLKELVERQLGDSPQT